MNKIKPAAEPARPKGPWAWVPSLYFAEGIPYILVNTLSVIFYKRMGLSNADIALYTSWLYLPWVIKPLWGPLVDMLRTKRFWILAMQLMVGGGLAGVALTIPLEGYVKYTLAFYWLLAFSSATHDIAADGFYMLGLSKHDQAFFVGVRSTFYRLAMLTGQGLLVIVAGALEANTGLPPLELEVRSVAGATPASFDPGPYSWKEEGGEQAFLAREALDIGLEPLSVKDAARLMEAVESWNLEQGFYRDRQAPFDAEGGGTTGNVGYTYIKLKQAPEEGENIVLNLSFSKGDKSIALARSYRFEFNDSNWDQPAFVVFTLDPKLDRLSTATFEGLSGNLRFAWSMVFFLVAVLFLGFHVYHRFALPRPAGDRANRAGESGLLAEFLETFASFFKRREIGVILLFLLVYRLGESQLVKMASPFLLDSREAMGLGLTTGEIGLIYGTLGIVFLSLGGIIGGIAASRKGLKYWLWWMVAAMNLPNLVYVFLSYVLPDALWVVGASVAVEQFGYGFGFTAYMLYMIYVSDGKHKTAHFALTTGFMALGMMIPGMVSGWVQELVGYQHFFIWVMACTIPGFVLIPFLKIDPGFGKKETS